MTATNPITGDLIASKAATEEYRANWEQIFGKPPVKTYAGGKPNYVTPEEQHSHDVKKKTGGLIMERDDIIRMAREAGHKTRLDSANASFLARFAALVAAAEREACAKVCDTHAEFHRGNRQFTYAGADVKCAAAIRARGQA